MIKIVDLSKIKSILPKVDLINDFGAIYNQSSYLNLNC